MSPAILVGVWALPAVAIKVAEQWEKVAVLRLGRYVGLARARVVSHHSARRFDKPSILSTSGCGWHSVTAESTLTRDTVPVNVDAIVFWLVWNAEKSILEVEDFTKPSR